MKYLNSYVKTEQIFSYNMCLLTKNEISNLIVEWNSLLEYFAYPSTYMAKSKLTVFINKNIIFVVNAKVAFSNLL